MLVGGCSGFAAVRRWSVPHNWSPWRDREWWVRTWLSQLVDGMTDLHMAVFERSGHGTFGVPGQPS